MDEPSDEPQDFPRKYRFPPFPPLPPGVKITLFKDFQEFGTRVIDDNGIERDGLGIPTIRLPKSKKKKKSHGIRGPGPKKEWWEEWEAAGTQLPIAAYDSNPDPVDRFHQAAMEFEQFYTLPDQLYMQKLWVGFKNFAGLAPSSLKSSSKTAADEDEVMSDDEDFATGGEVFENPVASDGANVNAAAGLTANDAPSASNSNENRQGKQQCSEDRAAIFLADPVRAMQVFLSSYMRQSGLMWDRLKLAAAPRLMRFFVNFVFRAGAYDLQLTPNVLTRTLAIIDTAARELPAIPIVSNALPDAFGVACRTEMGRQTAPLVLALRKDDDAKMSELATVPASDADADIRAREGKDTASDRGENTDAKESDAPVSNTNEDVAAAPTNENADMDDASGWGGGGWADDESVSIPLVGGKPPRPLSPRSEWALPATPTLETILGVATASVLLRTHAPGVVEWSMRRLVSLSPPLAAADGVAEEAHVDPTAIPVVDPEHVKRALEGRLWRAVLAPWLGWDGDGASNKEASMPRILPSSRGVVDGASSWGAEAKLDTNASAPTALFKPHDPMADHITVLLDGAAAETLSVGVGLGGTWVQLARLGSLQARVGADKGGTKEAMTNTSEGMSATEERNRYWYMDELIMILPSYWAV
ncbi:hypothetical protein C8R43DRAFT_357711 [Mycena crocata]|nr:hypothetical protein C8R43DRAFT_357711 [Mycena crocata]